MLVLSRKRGEGVVITVNGVRVRVVFVDIRGDKARLGFDAPADVTVHREEVQANIDRGDEHARS